MTMKKQDRIRDDEHLERIRNMDCIACDAPPKSDPAHIREGCYSIGMKPGDDLTVPLCRGCHDRQHRYGEKNFWNAVFAINRDLCIEGIKAIAKQLYAVAKTTK